MLIAATVAPIICPHAEPSTRLEGRIQLGTCIRYLRTDLPSSYEHRNHQHEWPRRRLGAAGLHAADSAEQPLRLAEFDRLFSTSLRGLERIRPTTLRLRLDPQAEETARNLTDRETGCCSFFTFTFARSGDHVMLETSVPAAHVAVLDALASRAAASAALSS